MLAHSRGLALLALLISSPVFAVGDVLITTEAATVYEVHKDDNSIEKGAWPTTEVECLTRAKALKPSGSCVIRRKFTSVGSCVKDAPAWPLILDTEGRMVRPGIRPALLPNGEWGPSEEEGFVLKPYPDCWVPGWVPFTGEWHAPEGAPVNEPANWPPPLPVVP